MISISPGSGAAATSHPGSSFALQTPPPTETCPLAPDQVQTEADDPISRSGPVSTLARNADLVFAVPTRMRARAMTPKAIEIERVHQSPAPDALIDNPTPAAAHIAPRTATTPPEGRWASTTMATAPTITSTKPKATTILASLCRFFDGTSRSEEPGRTFAALSSGRCRSSLSRPAPGPS